MVIIVIIIIINNNNNNILSRIKVVDLVSLFQFMAMHLVTSHHMLLVTGWTMEWVEELGEDQSTNRWAEAWMMCLSQTMDFVPLVHALMNLDLVEYPQTGLGLV